MDIVPLLDERRLRRQEHPRPGEERNEQRHKQIHHREGIQGGAQFPLRRTQGDEDRECRKLEYAPVREEGLRETLSVIEQGWHVRQEDSQQVPPERCQPANGIANPGPPMEGEDQEQRDEIEGERPVGPDHARDGQQVEKVHGEQQEQEDPHLNVVSLLPLYAPGVSFHRVRKIKENNLRARATDQRG